MRYVMRDCLCIVVVAAVGIMVMVGRVAGDGETAPEDLTCFSGGPQDLT